MTPVLNPNWNIPRTAEKIANTSIHVKPCVTWIGRRKEHRDEDHTKWRDNNPADASRNRSVTDFVLFFFKNRETRVRERHV